MVVGSCNCLFSKMNKSDLQKYLNNYMIDYQSKLNIEEDAVFGLEIEFDGIKYKRFKEIYGLDEIKKEY